MTHICVAPLSPRTKNISKNWNSNSFFFAPQRFSVFFQGGGGGMKCKRGKWTYGKTGEQKISFLSAPSHEYPRANFLLFHFLSWGQRSDWQTLEFLTGFIIKITISSNLTGLFNTLCFLNLTASVKWIVQIKNWIELKYRRESINKMLLLDTCYWTPVIVQLNKPIQKRSSWLSGQLATRKWLLWIAAGNLWETVAKTKWRIFYLNINCYLTLEGM